MELEYGDGRHYEPKSLPGTVAGRTTLYYHSDIKFYKSIKNITRACRVDPVQHNLTNFRPMP